MTIDLLLKIYLIVSVVLIGWTFSIWSSYGWINKLAKAGFVAAFTAGCVLIAKVVF